MKEKTKQFILQEAKNAGWQGDEAALLNLLDDKVEEPGDKMTKSEKEEKEKKGREDIKASVVAALELCFLYEENVKYYEKIAKEDEKAIEAFTQYRIWDYKRKMLVGMRLSLAVNDALFGEDREVLITAVREMLSWFCTQPGANCSKENNKLANFAPILSFDSLEELEEHEYDIFCEGFLASMRVERRKLSEEIKEIKNDKK